MEDTKKDIDDDFFKPDFSYLENNEKDTLPFQSEAEERAYFIAMHEKEKEEQKPSFNIFPMHEILEIELPPKKYILYPIMQSKALVMLFADRGLGKTFASLNIAYAVASGGSFFNWHAEKARKVLYIDGEMPFHSMQERIAQIVAGSEKAVPNGYLNFLTPDLQDEDVFMPNLATKEGQEAIEPHLEGVKLIVLDNLATLCRHGRANDEESFLPVQEWLLKLRRRGISVLLVHHASKNGSQRGTSSKEDTLDTVIQLKRPSDYETEQGARFEVHLTKARGIFGEDAEPFEAQLSTMGGVSTWMVRKLDAVLVEKVKGFASDGLSQRDIAAELGLGLGTVNRICKKNNIITQGRKSKGL